MMKQLTRVSEVKIAYRPKMKASERLKVRNANDAYEVFINQWDKDTIELLEEFKIMLLDKNKRVLGIARISVGGIDQTVVDPKIIFAIALKSKASSIILAHNHPSGNIQASLMDNRITEKLRDGGKLLEIEVCDHLIITKDSYYSFEENGDNH